MRHLFAATGIAAIVATSTLVAGACAEGGSAPLIERTKLFGNPSRTAGRISPDGKWLSWLAPRDGMLNVWVAPVAAPNEAPTADR